MIYGVEAWAESTIPPSPPPPAVPAIFIAVGSIGASTPLLIATETNDAAVWVSRSTAAALASPTAILQCIAYSPTLGRWVAAGYDSTSNFGDPRVIYSDDGGNTWTAATPDPTTNFFINSICWTGTGFIAVGQDSGFTNPRIMTSANGISWAQRTSAPTTVTLWNGVSGVSGTAVAVGTGTTKLSFSSNDGVGWSTETAPTGMTQINGVVCVPNGTHVCVGFGSSTNEIGSSINGTSWTTRAAPADHQYYGVAYNGSLYVAVGMDGSSNLTPRIASSVNGTTGWTQRTPDPSSGGTDGINLLSVGTNEAGGFVAVGRDNNAFNTSFIMYSADGLTWVARTPPVTNCILQGVAGLPPLMYHPQAASAHLAQSTPTRTP